MWQGEHIEKMGPEQPENESAKFWDQKKIEKLEATGWSPKLIWEREGVVLGKLGKDLKRAGEAIPGMRVSFAVRNIGLVVKMLYRADHQRGNCSHAVGFSWDEVERAGENENFRESLVMQIYGDFFSEFIRLVLKETE